jgi:hypothetical protein
MRFSLSSGTKCTEQFEIRQLPKETIMNRKQFLLTSIAILVALVVGAALNNILHIQAAQAQASRTIPKSWGTVKGAAGEHLIFEDSAGTIRLVYIGPELNSTKVSEFQRN